MICPHCGFEAPDDAPNCLSCGYALRPPDAPRPRKSNLVLVLLATVAVITGFMLAIRQFRGEQQTNISFFGKRAHYMFPEQAFTLTPDSVPSVSIRNPRRTPVCRLYGAASSASQDVSLAVVDSANLGRLKSNAPYQAVYETRLSGYVEFNVQTEGGDAAHHVAFRYTGPDSASARLDRLRVQCFEKW